MDADVEMDLNEEGSRSQSLADPLEIESNPNITCATPRRLSSSSVESAKIPAEENFKEAPNTVATTAIEADSSTTVTHLVRSSRKKRSIGLMEDLWDESIFEDPARVTKTTPVIKISFGSEGAGTVLKIPSKVHHTYASDTEDTSPVNDPLRLEDSSKDPFEAQFQPDQSTDESDPLRLPATRDCEDSAKAAKKALKKAKKKVLKIMYGATSPARSPCSTSPR